MARSRASAKKLGTMFESAIVTRLQAAFPDNDHIERRAKTGGKDRGDIAGIRLPDGRRVVIEAKNTATLNLAGWVKEAEVERRNDEAAVGMVIHKRARVGMENMDEQYVTMTMRDLIVLLGGIVGYAPPD